MKKQGLIYMFTGDGKGKTSAALGTIFRATAYGWKIGVVQFMKGKWKCGEAELAEKFENIDWYQDASGFYKILDDTYSEEQHKEMVKHGWERAKEMLQSNKYQLVVLDEINVAIDMGLISLETVLQDLQQKREDLHVIVTGRGAKKEMEDVCDLVTELQHKKHPFDNGIQAVQGLDY